MYFYHTFINPKSACEHVAIIVSVFLFFYAEINSHEKWMGDTRHPVKDQGVTPLKKECKFVDRSYDLQYITIVDTDQIMHAKSNGIEIVFFFHYFLRIDKMLTVPLRVWHPGDATEVKSRLWS